jgi:ribonuclease HII
MYGSKLIRYNNLLICGIDEAGRGSVIGPMVISGISIKNQYQKIGGYWSKRLKSFNQE